MKTLIIILIGILPAFVQAQSKQDTLYVYGPGGPGAAMEECAKVFSMKNSIPVKVTAGPEAKWIEQAKQNADLVFGGAEYMLTQFTADHPELIDASARTELYKRAAAILVRPGNPKNIRNIKDLTKPGIKLLDVNGAGQFGMWEDIAGKQNLIAEIQQNIGRSYANTALGIEAWKSDNSYDAWICYASWYNSLRDVTYLVKIPKKQTVYRGTPVAISAITDQKEVASAFITFMKSPAGHTVFKKWGWE
ncbi:substrate-binding domain-containing protein [Daejeonella sp.]|uniref:substrate-binding domain-containing protein n=1 Tax=Daejeonella sp. TaxID=2805397 RepID=UPI002731CF79|nr:substrate-binding domain-containing protein [Daejeonella sp.]MDP2415415.1 substrate-binding domain-containing protein [Daejeonella sp.]